MSAADPRPALWVFSAMTAEVAPLVATLERRGATLRSGRARAIEGVIDGRSVRVVSTGEGRAQALAGVSWVLETLPKAGAVAPKALLVGVAGGLSPGATVGQTLWAGSVHHVVQVVREGAGDRLAGTIRPHAVDAGAAVGGAGILGDLVTVDEVITRPARGAELWEIAGRPPLAAVDMETFHWASALEQAGITWSAVRVISDAAHEELPDYLARCFDPQRGVRRGLVLAHLLRRPASLGALLRLRRRVSAAAETLAAAVIDRLRGGDGVRASGPSPAASSRMVSG